MRKIYSLKRLEEEASEPVLLKTSSNFFKGDNFKLGLLNVFSFIAITIISGSVWTPLVLGAHAVGTYFYIQAFSRLKTLKSKRLTYYAFFLTHVGIFLWFQANGYIGILNIENVTSPQTLPFLIGFAFYILQSVTILNAVYRGFIEPLDFQTYLLAISFCGAFLAGPIFNLDQLKKFKFLKISSPSLERIYDNSHLFVGALFFKYVFANWLSQWVDIKEVDSPLGIAGSVLCFELQVYFDFAGYSLMALFLCRLFNIPMYFNFQHPFAAKDIPEFWRRWHVGLGTWFKENIFSPLKGKWGSKWGTKLAIPLAVFLCSAMWHGPTRNFFLWGLMHGLAFIVAVNVISKFSGYRAGRLFSKVYVLVVIFYGRLLFMDSNYPRLIAKFKELGHFRRMVEEFLLKLPSNQENFKALLYSHGDDLFVGVLIFLFICYEIFAPAQFTRQDRPYNYFKPGFVSIGLFILMLLLLQPMHRVGFVYGR